MCSEAYWSWTLAENQRKLIPEVGALDSESSAPNPREFNPQTNRNFLDGLSEHGHTKEKSRLETIRKAVQRLVLGC